MCGRKKEFRPETRRERYEKAAVNEKLIMNLRDIQCTMRALYEGKGSRRRALIVLGRTGPIAQKDFTDRMELQPGSVSDLLRGLEEHGLIRRCESPDDKRTALIELTEAGQAASEDAAQQRLERHRVMFSDLSETEKNQLNTLLEKLNRSWQEKFGDSEK